MHAEARQYVHDTLLGSYYGHVVEVGGRNINGGVRDLIEHDEWLSIDLEAGPDVDVVGDCRWWRPPWPADLVLVLEVLEHAPDPEGIIESAKSYLAKGGRLLVTCAGPGRAPHSGHDGTPHLRDGEHYQNIERDQLDAMLADDLRDVELIYDPNACDLRATGVRR